MPRLWETIWITCNDLPCKQIKADSAVITRQRLLYVFQHSPAMDEGKTLKIRLTFSVILVGVALLFAAVVTDHWAVLSPEVLHYNATCEAAHFGLWRLCTKRIYVQDTKEKGCGPISLPGGTCQCSFHIPSQKCLRENATLLLFMSFRNLQDILKRRYGSLFALHLVLQDFLSEFGSILAWKYTLFSYFLEAYLKYMMYCHSTYLQVYSVHCLSVASVQKKKEYSSYNR